MLTKNQKSTKLSKEIHKQVVTQTEFKEIESRFSNFTEFLSDHLKHTVLKEYFSDSDFTFIKIAIMGSFALKNAIKKVKSEKDTRYNDLDLKIIFSHHFLNVPPETLVSVIREAIKIYASRHNLNYEDNERCTHLLYKDITVDISVAVRTAFESEYLKIAVFDKTSKKYIWKYGSPEKYIRYFEEVSKKSIVQLNERLLKNDANVEIDELEFQDEVLGPIIYASMLVKSHRNEMFLDDLSNKKSVKSIMVTTLCLNLYRPGDDVIDLVDKFIEFLNYKVRIPNLTLDVFDPIDLHENYGAYLDNPSKREVFINWLDRFITAWSQIKEQSEQIGMTESLKKFFDSDVINYQTNKYAQDLNHKISSQQAHLAPGGAVLLGKKQEDAIPLTKTKHWGSIQLTETFNNSILTFNALTLEEQNQLMKKHFPQFKLIYPPTSNYISWIGDIVSPYSGKKRKVEIQYSLGWIFPRVYVEGVTSNAPHIHISLGNCLCLYKPKFTNWNYSMPISETIIPWTINWIIQWEVWQVTGKYNGLEEKH